MTTLIEWLEHKVKTEESTAEECIQEMEDEESANSHLAKATAFQEVLDFIKSGNVENDLQLFLMFQIILKLHDWRGTKNRC